jgi:exodeoxyribonuclease VII large subunit
MSDFGSAAPTTNAAEMTVSELSGRLRLTVEEAFGHVRVRGEISGFRGVHGSGHCYFSLKDEGARIDAVVWRTTLARLRFKPQEGLEVIATGRITTYPGKSTYQIIIDALEPAGIGALMALLDQRRRTLAAEGLFDAARKRPLPFLPGVIGVVTSPSGAVIRDILHRLADRFPRRVLVWPVRVQGETSAAEVAAAIAGFNALPVDGLIPRPDVIIVARGGGSLEDLWSFNEEAVVRAAAASRIPLISAVGHETDTTLIDLAADRRAPTPSAAAEIAVPVRRELMAQNAALAGRLAGGLLRLVERRRQALAAAARVLPSAEALFALRRQRLDLAAGRLAAALAGNAQAQRRRFARVAAALQPGVLAQRVDAWGHRLGALDLRRRRALDTTLAAGCQRLAHGDARLGPALTGAARIKRIALVGAAARLQPAVLRRLIGDRRRRLAALDQLRIAYSYQGVLARGFALVRGADDRPIRTAAAVVPGSAVSLEFQDGRVAATTAGRSARVKPAGAGQDDLFRETNAPPGAPPGTK